MRSLTAPLVKLAVFALVTILASYVLIATITNSGYGKQNTYRALFSDVTGLVKGDEVRIAGVRVGQVKSISLASADKPIQGKPEADGTRIAQRITQEELACMVGTTRSRVGFFLKRFADAGLIRRGGGVFLTVEEDALAAYVGKPGEAT